MNLQELWKRAINKGIDKEMLGWPPPCWGTYYQPERPLRMTGNKVSEKNKMSKCV